MRDWGLTMKDSSYNNVSGVSLDIYTQTTFIRLLFFLLDSSTFLSPILHVDFELSAHCMYYTLHNQMHLLSSSHVKCGYGACRLCFENYAEPLNPPSNTAFPSLIQRSTRRLNSFSRCECIPCPVFSHCNNSTRFGWPSPSFSTPFIASHILKDPDGRTRWSSSPVTMAILGTFAAM